MTSRLGYDANYKRPERTFQENLSQDQIKEKLLGYEVVENIAEVPANTHIRYFSIRGNKRLFRLGGFLQKKDNASKYVVLSNGKKSWTAQTGSCIFYRKLKSEELMLQNKERETELVDQFNEETERMREEFQQQTEQIQMSRIKDEQKIQKQLKKQNKVQEQQYSEQMTKLMAQVDKLQKDLEDKDALVKKLAKKVNKYKYTQRRSLSGQN